MYSCILQKYQRPLLVQLTDPKHTYKLPLPEVEPSQVSIGVILVTANPSYENVVPMSERTFKSSNYRR